MVRRPSPLATPGRLAEAGIDPLVDPEGEAGGLCSRYTLDEAFARAQPGVRATFDHSVELIERCGPVAVIAQKTRIATMVTVEAYRPSWIIHRLEVRDPADLDDPRIAAWLCESYRDLGLRGSLAARR